MSAKPSTRPWTAANAAADPAMAIMRPNGRRRLRPTPKEQLLDERADQDDERDVEGEHRLVGRRPVVGHEALLAEGFRPSALRAPPTITTSRNVAIAISTARPTRCGMRSARSSRTEGESECDAAEEDPLREARRREARAVQQRVVDRVEVGDVATVDLREGQQRDEREPDRRASSDGPRAPPSLVDERPPSSRSCGGGVETLPTREEANALPQVRTLAEELVEHRASLAAAQLERKKLALQIAGNRAASTRPARPPGRADRPRARRRRPLP